MIKERRDCIAIAETGQGKTAVFLIPIISYLIKRYSIQSSMSHQRMSHRISQTSENMLATPKVVIISPTRELAVQIATDARCLALDTRLLDSIALVYGGASMEDQAESLVKGGCEILVGTIGRLLDFIQRDMISIAQIEYLVIDQLT